MSELPTLNFDHNISIIKDGTPGDFHLMQVSPAGTVGNIDDYGEFINIEDMFDRYTSDLKPTLWCQINDITTLLTNEDVPMIRIRFFISLGINTNVRQGEFYILIDHMMRQIWLLKNCRPGTSFVLQRSHAIEGTFPWDIYKMILF